MRTPRIGVTGMWSSQVHGLRFDGNTVAVAMLRSVVAAGGEPLTLFAESPLTVDERLQGIDGLLIPGGFDIDPARYGQERDASVTVADSPQQDDFEASLLNAAITKNIPVLAVCRGFQLLNVEYGGTLLQDVPADSVHRNSVHGVEMCSDSRLAQAVGKTRIAVSSYHHQSVEKVGQGLRVAGTAPDGTVEALEHDAADLIAVQWHPEDTALTEPDQLAIFEWLVDRARSHFSRRGTE